MSCKRRLVKVEMEYDNGDIQHLAGKDAEEWLQTINSHLTFTFVHGMAFPEFQWKQADRKGMECRRRTSTSCKRDLTASSVMAAVEKGIQMNVKRLKGTKKAAELLREMSVNPDHSFALCHHAEFKCADCVFVGLFGCTCIGRSPCPQDVGVVDKHAPDRIRSNVERREVWRTLICFMAAMLEVEL